MHILLHLPIFDVPNTVIPIPPFVLSGYLSKYIFSVSLQISQLCNETVQKLFRVIRGVNDNLARGGKGRVPEFRPLAFQGGGGKFFGGTVLCYIL